MLTLYATDKDRLQTTECDSSVTHISGLVWIDLFNPSGEEEAKVERLLGIDIPTRAEMHEIELSNRLYQENGTLYLTATIITGVDMNNPEAHAITFVLTGNCLVTVRYSNPAFFTIFVERARKNGALYSHGHAVLAGLLEAIVNRVADILENAGHRIDIIAQEIFRPDPDPRKISAVSARPDFAVTLRQIGVNGDLISKMRESLISLSRLVSFLLSFDYYKATSPEHAKIETLRHDIPALSDHAGFLSNKISFLLDATLGMVNIQQNTIIKIFSVAAVIFLPPTLVASIYGMNFSYMPELHWLFGYPMAIILMVLSAFLPYTFFRKKGWL